MSPWIRASANKLGVWMLLLHAACYAHAVTTSGLHLPPPDAPAPHWPWWLRLLAVIGVLVFVRVVAGVVRKSGGPQKPS